MNRVEITKRLKDIKDEIDALEAEKKALQAKAVAQGWATIKVHLRWSTPTLDWWQEKHPRTWERYCTQKPINRFTPEKV